MANLKEIKRRIQSVKNTQQITKAMKLVAASKLRKAQQAILEARPYAIKMMEVLNHLAARCNSDVHPLLDVREGNRHLLLIITSDKGLCGGFNGTIIRKTAQYLKDNDENENSLIVALYPSRPTKPHEVYTASFQCNQCLLTYSEPERAVSLPELVKEISNISGPLKLCGTLSDEQKEMLPGKLAAGFVSQLQSAETIGKIGIQRWGHDCVGDDLYGIKPMYALPSQAEVNFDVRI